MESEDAEDGLAGTGSVVFQVFQAQKVTVDAEGCQVRFTYSNLVS